MIERGRAGGDTRAFDPTGLAEKHATIVSDAAAVATIVGLLQGLDRSRKGEARGSG
jgi:hypothetical protein